MSQSRRCKGPRQVSVSYRSGSNNRKIRPAAALAAIVAGLAATTVSADTLAQPKDNSLERSAANYIRFREDVAAIEAMPFTDEEVTREAHRRLSTHDSTELAGGWVAYAALVAADSPAFAEAIQDEIKKKSNRRKGVIGGVDGLMANIAQDPAYLRNLSGADEAVSAILAMSVQDSTRIAELGDAFKTQAYAMQKTSWGKKRISPPQSRLDEAANYGRARAKPATPVFERPVNDGVMAPALANARQEWAADWGASGGAGRVSEKSADIIINNILNLAARYSTNALNPRLVEVYAANPKSERCLSMAKLTLDQCIAATRTPYEEAFCLGEHGLNDVATCNGWVADAGAS
ncbi:hypothetical protein PUV54_03275 [Hyphococcus flavus]|uniref:Secreted protein n=1 Tax=Hyphococcus flavus TaxID=1866326 RepID=A0AAE9ZC88_9PROT|nr:hypothetical protein [Hyphococcus flavus]WDI32213.1 hypothetical protein PUV54_03275 [Hyphococcus flavus]